ncbi:MAG: hypothetical protein M1829_006762 [Trizodia sp. TS-e1964]|nr:MAG: hypothetical protein M1829_006762 [Trizodia sp. TS-e1964]
MDKEGYVKVDTLHRVDMAILEYYGEWYGKLKLTPESLKTLQKKVLKPQQGDKRQQLKFEFQAHAAASLNRATTVVQEVPLDVQPYHLLNEETDSAFFVPPPKQDRAHQSNRQLPPRQDRAHHSTRQPLLPPHSKQYRVAHSTHQQLLRTPDITSDLPQYYQTFPPRESHWQGRRSVLPRIRSLPSAPSIPWSSILKFLAVCAIFGLLGYSTYFLGSKIFTGVRSVWAAALTSWRGLKGWLGLHIL